MLQALEEQYKTEEGYAISHHEFRFSEKAELEITIIPPQLDQCVIAMKPAPAKVY